jgi:hypothetical protein
VGEGEEGEGEGEGGGGGCFGSTMSATPPNPFSGAPLLVGLVLVALLVLPLRKARTEA